MIKSTPISPAYDKFVKAGRSVNSSKRAQKNKPPKPKVDISMCIGKFMLAGTDTFNQKAMGACIPDGNNIASVRSFVKRQISVVIGTAGVGFIHFFHPLANDAPAFVVTNSSFAGTTVQWLSADNALITGCQIDQTLNTPFESDDLCKGADSIDSRSGVQGRIVAAGASFRYTGKEIDRAGQVYAYTNPTHDSSASYINLANVEVIYSGPTYAANVETLIVEAAREDTHIPMFPVEEQELEYSNEDFGSSSQIIYPWSGGARVQPGGYSYTFTTPTTVSHRVGIPTTTIVFQGTAGSSYLVNYGQHMEFAGIGVNAFSKFPAESDPVGVRDLMGASAHFQLNRKRQPGVNANVEFMGAIREVQNARARKFTL